LKEWRETLGISQPELAKAAGVSKTLIALIEKKKRPLVQPSRDAIWDAMYGFMVDRVKNPSGAFKFWATFWGPSEAGQLMGLEKTPAQRTRDYARQIVGDHAAEKKELKESERRALELANRLIDLLNVETTKADAAAQAEEIREEIRQLSVKKAKG
jgi:transcriptional regulator with XRE-family HTH domain